jgi:acyl carrier protein
VDALPSREGLALFDAAIARDEAVLVPARLTLPASGAPDGGHADSPLLRGLTGATTGPAALAAPVGQESDALPEPALARQVRSLPRADAAVVVLDAVRAQTAIVLGHEGTGPIGSAAAFRELGIDSLMALELRNRLAEVTGLKLPATLAFEYPNAGAVAQFLSAGLAADSRDDRESPVECLTKEIEGLDARLAGTFPALAQEDKATISAALGELQRRVRSIAGERSPDGIVDRISSASAGELLSLLDKELG